MSKFKDGDRVQMTPETAKANQGARSLTGVVVGQARNPAEVRIRRDGQKTVVLWHETAWELRENSPMNNKQATTEIELLQEIREVVKLVAHPKFDAEGDGIYYYLIKTDIERARALLSKLGIRP